jgi:eukaryotic-like serine/threonine-protein kinase
MLTNGQHIDRYEITGILGNGPFSQTYKARTTEGQEVSLKFPAPALIGEPGTYERFRREYAIGQELDHPAIPRAIAFADTPEGPFIAFEYVEGRSLREALNAQTTIPLPQALDIALKVARALAFCHARGVFHRDLKPENVIVGPEGDVHIMDFGIALMEQARRITWQAFSQAMGTPDYMAPEQIQGKRGDARTDIYALGMILYEMTTGHLPFSGDNALAILSQHLRAAPVSPLTYNSALPPGVEAIIMKAIRRNPDERYETAEEMAQDLDHYEDLELSQFPAGREAPVRAALGERQILLVGLGITVGFLVLVALIVLIAVHLQG